MIILTFQRYRETWGFSVVAKITFILYPIRMSVTLSIWQTLNDNVLVSVFDLCGTPLHGGHQAVHVWIVTSQGGDTGQQKVQTDR